jgi:hypothetical protein
LLLAILALAGCLMRDTRLEVHLRPESGPATTEFRDLRKFVESAIEKEGMQKARCFDRESGELCQYVFPERVAADRAHKISIDAYFDPAERSVEVAVLEHRDNAYENAVGIRDRLLAAVKQRFGDASCESRKALVIPTGIMHCEVGG